MLSDDVFRALLDLFICSDPYPESCADGHAIIDAFLDSEARERGRENWVIAYHDFMPSDVPPAPPEATP